MKEHLYEHFCDGEHSGFLNDVSITFVDKTDPVNSLQTETENYWKHTLKIFAPYDLNIKKMCIGFIVDFDLIYMNWYYLRSCCCSYTYCQQLLVIRDITNKMKAIVMIRV